MYRTTLTHHGILGMKWGKKNGPPYPLNASNHSVSEKKAGWQKSLGKDSQDDAKQKGLTDKQKKAIKIGAAAAGVALAACGTYYLYKSGKLDNLIEMGKNNVKGLAGDADIIDFGEKAKPVTGTIRKLAGKESIKDSLRNANPLRGTTEGRNNCVPSALAGFLRQAGYDVTAKSTGGVMQNTAGVVEEVFKGVKVLEGSASKFGRSREDAAEMLVKRFGDNAEGLCSIQWKTGGGHCFSWKIVNGVVEFLDYQNGRGDAEVAKYFGLIDTSEYLTLARLDGLEIDMNALSKYVNI